MRTSFNTRPQRHALTTELSDALRESIPGLCRRSTWATLGRRPVHRTAAGQLESRDSLESRNRMPSDKSEPSPELYRREQQVAIAAVTRAAQLCRSVRAEMATVDAVEKSDRSPVTIADLGSQALVCRDLVAAFPGDPIVGEEDATWLRRPENAAHLAQVTDRVRRLVPDATPESVCDWIDAGNGQVANRFWTLDPIDGTKGFLRDDQYAIALALIEDGEVKVAALGCPALPLDLEDPLSAAGTLFVAVRDEGATMAPLGEGSFMSPFVPIRVAQPSDELRLRFVESVEADHGDAALQAAIARAAGISRPPLRLDSQVKYGAVARGDAALYLRLPSPRHQDYREKIWDHAAGALIVEAAGGRVTDMHGRPLDFASDALLHGTRGIVVSNGSLHDAVLAAIAG